MPKITKKKTSTSAKNTPTQADEKPLIGPNTILKITVPKGEANQAYQSALIKLARKVKIDGFRQGKVPAKLAEETIGEAQIIRAALEQVVPPLFDQAVKDAQKIPLTHPEFNPLSLKKNEDWVIEAHIAEKPNLDVKKYQDIVKKAKKEAAQHQLELDKADKAKQNKKTAKTNEATHSDHHHHDNPNDHTLQHIYSALVQEIKPQVPELLVKAEVKADLDDLLSRLKSINLTFDDFLAQRQIKFEDMSRELTIQALGRLQLSFIIQEIIDLEGLTVHKKEIDDMIAQTKDENLKIRQQLDRRYHELLRQTLLRQKLADFLLKI